MICRERRSAQQNLEQLNGVESTMAMRRGDYVLPEITKWQDISSRREGYGSSGRKLTDSELHIQKALRSQVSLHFHNVPLTEIISHVANTHKINIVLDRKASLAGSMVDVAKEDGVDQVLLFVVDILNEEATLLVPNDLVKGVAEKSFGASVDGDAVVLPGIMSRKKQIIPNLKV